MRPTLLHRRQSTPKSKENMTKGQRVAHVDNDERMEHDIKAALAAHCLRLCSLFTHGSPLETAIDS